ncbi:MAG: TonB-dependent receptor [Verrucomicrobia bacterium]|nr:TonB-dependent receptor [Verrucomicrobiota bacterium]
MYTTHNDRRFRLIATIAATTWLFGGHLAAAEPKTTEMDPFKVAAEFGLEGLRIQNSNSAINQSRLELHGVGQMQDVSGLAPNLFSNNSDTRGFGDVLALRGVANSIFFSAPAVVLSIDDVPGGSVSSYPSALLTIDTLVVKAGPQGTDYGRNAPGGVIDIRTRAPGAKHQGNVQVEYGSFNHSAVQAAFDGPLSDKAGYAVSVGLADRDGYVENTFRKLSADDRRSLAGRGALYWRPDDKLQLRFGVAMEKVGDDAVRLSSLASRDPFAVSSDLNGETKIDRLQLSFQARRKFDWGTVTATTSRQDWDLNPSSTDLDLSSLPLAFSRVAQGEEAWTQEIRFESTPGSNKAQWRAGLFYFDSSIDGDALREFIVPPGAFVPRGFVQTERTVFTIGQTNLAGYANIDRPLTEKSILKLGLRLEHSESEMDRSKTSSNNFGFPVPPDPRLNRSQNHDDVSLSAGLVHAVSDSLSLVARTSLAHKPEGYSAFTGNPQLARFGRERLWSSEAGATFGQPKGRFGGSVLGFWSVIDGYQLERTVPNSTDFVVVNAKTVTSRGIEAKFMWTPVERVWCDFQIGCTDARFDDHRDATGTSVDGNHVPFIPKLTLRTGVTVDLANGLSANVSCTAVGRSFFDERNTATFSQKSYGIVSAQLRYRIEQWTMALYGHNLFERDYYQFINPEIFAGSPGAPRRIGVQLSYHY